MSTRAVIVIPRMRASLSACAPQMVNLQTAWNSTTRIKEVRRANAVITPGMGVYEGEMVLYEVEHGIGILNFGGLN